MSANFTSVSEKANRLVQKGKHDKALAIWQRFIEHADESDAAGAHNIMGDICVRKKDTLAAVDHYLAASESYERLNFALKAIATLKKILKLDASLLEVHIRLGDLHARREMVGNAVEAYLTVARLHVSRDETDEALSMIQKIRILDPVNIRHRLQLAAELFELGFSDQAGDETLNAVDLFLQDENLEEATRYCRHLLDLQPDNVGARERLERISRWDVDPALTAATTLSHDDDDNDPESAIDDLFAELDGDFGEASTSKPSPVVSSSDEADADAPTEFNLEDMLESTSHSIPTVDSADDDPVLGSMDFGQLSLDNPDTDDNLPLSSENVLAADGMGDEDNKFRQQAFDHLDAGEFEASLGLFDQFVSKSLERGEFQEADTALRAYLAIDPDNARAHEIHLRIFADREPEREAETLEKLISLYQDSQPDRAEAYIQRLDILSDPSLALVDFGAPTSEAPAPPVWEGSGNGFGDAFAADSSGDAPLDINLQGGQDVAQTAPQEIAEQTLDAPIDASEIDFSQVEPHEEATTEGDDLAAELSGMDLNLFDEAPTPVIDLALDSEPGESDDDGVMVVDLDDPTALPDNTEDLFQVSLGERPADDGNLQPDPLPESNAPSIHTTDAADLFQFSWSSDGEQAPKAPSAPLAETVREGFQPTPAKTVRAMSEAPTAPPTEPDLHDEPVSIAIEETRKVLPTTNFVSAPPPAMPSAELRETLAEARFYEHQNLTDEAIKVYRTVLASHPHEPTAQERLGALGITHSPADNRAIPAKKAPATPTFVDDGDEFAAFTNSIQDTLEKEVGTEWRRVSEDARFDEILDAFRSGISEQISEDDSETHYDLGVAYREMGLVEEAIGEFQLAIKGTLRFADSCIMLANCFADMGKPHLGMGQLRQAVDKVSCDDESWIPLAYELGSLLEVAGDKDEARRVFEEVYSRDITFRDVAKRVEALSQDRPSLLNRRA